MSDESFFDRLDEDMEKIFDELTSEDGDDEDDSDSTVSEDESEATEDSGTESEEEKPSKRGKGKRRADIEQSIEASGDAEAEEDDATEEDYSAEEGDNSQEVSAEESAGQEEVDADVINPPNSYSAKFKATWNKIPNEARREILQREQERTEYYRANQQRIEMAARMEKAAMPYMANIRAAGVTPDQAFANLLDTQHRLTTASPDERAMMALQIAQSYGANMNLLKDMLNGEQSRMPQQNPELIEMRNQVSYLRNQVLAKENEAYQAEVKKVDMALNSFQNAKNLDGTLKYPYFSNVESRMVDLIPSIKAEHPTASYEDILDKAYDSAVWADPQTRSLMTTSLTVKARENASKQKKERIEQAKKANRNNFQSKPKHALSTQKPSSSLDETLEQTYERVSRG